MASNLTTVIVSAFPGCGKTYMVNHCSEYKIKMYGIEHVCQCKDSDSSKYPDTSDKYQRYVDDIEYDIGSYDIIFVSQQEELRAELQRRGIPFIAVGPDQSPWLDEREKRLIKQQWFGRFLLRDNSHIKNFDEWIGKLEANWSAWASPDHLAEYGAKEVILLREDQYLSDIWAEIYWKAHGVTDIGVKPGSIHTYTQPNLKYVDNI